MSPSTSAAPKALKPRFPVSRGAPSKTIRIDLRVGVFERDGSIVSAITVAPLPPCFNPRAINGGILPWNFVLMFALPGCRGPMWGKR